MTPNSAYAALEARFRRLSGIDGALAVLNWDQSAMMPEGGSDARAEQVAVLSVLSHEILTASETADLLARADGEGPHLADGWRAANLREMRRRFAHATALTPALVEARAKANAACEMAWRQARADDDFKALVPHLETVLGLVREVAAAKAEALGVAPYDALLDEFEPDGRAAGIDRLFADLLSFLPDLLGQVLERQAARPAMPLPGPFPVEAQRQLGLLFMEALGFDFHHGRLDVSLHPFTGGVPDDVRITTRYSEADFSRALMGVLHETGHALYERGLPAQWRSQPVGQARGMTLHESQSLLVEMQVCRGDAFLGYAIPKMRQAFGGAGPAWETENVRRVYRRVARGLIRVDADEVSYPLHVILRYRLERAMLAGDLKVADLPGAWNEGMEKLVGVRPPGDRDGCMQDIHWPSGAFGYFPTYTLGALAAAQLFAAARRQDAAIEAGIAKGDFAPLLRWLRTHVHGQGSVASTDEILSRATGASLGTEAFRAHLHQRYLD